MVIQRSVSFSTVETLLHSFILLHFDFFYSILASLPKFEMLQLQPIFTCATRLRANLPKFSYMVIFGDTLHWLSNKERIKLSIHFLGWASLVRNHTDLDFMFQFQVNRVQQSLCFAAHGDVQVFALQKTQALAFYCCWFTSLCLPCFLFLSICLSVYVQITMI